MRRTLAVVALLLAPLAAWPSSPAQAQDVDRVRVLHLTVDSLHPSEVGPQTPTLMALREQGVWYEQARSVMASETLPNHVAMATGAYPERNGIPGNEGRGEPGDQDIHTSPIEGEDDLGDPDLLQVPSFAAVIEATCPDLRTVTVLSKAYVDNIFQPDPVDSRFPQEDFNIPESGHALDLTTVGFILDEVNSGAQFDYLFANLGDVDRTGHIDATGFTGIPVARQAAITDTDTLLGLLVQSLQQQGLWESTVLVVSSDHSMDFSNALDPTSYVDVGGALEADPRTAGKFFLGQNGGAGLIYLFEPDAADADEVLAAAHEILSALAGVDEVLYREPNRLDPGKDLATVHPDWHLAGTHRAGELFLTVPSGFKVSAPPESFDASAVNPLPGNHGSTVTRHVTALVTGGWDGLAAPASIAPSDPDAVDPVRFDDAPALPEQVEQVDYAPTFGWLLGVPDPGMPDGSPQWQGRVLTEAFAREPAPVCVAAAEPEPTPTPTASPTPIATETPDAVEPAPLPVTGSGWTGPALVGLALALALPGRRRSEARP